MDSEINENVAAPTPDSGLTLEAAREAYVQRNYAQYEKYFQAFDEVGGFRFTFSPAIFFAGILWFLYRRMYIESLAIFIIGTVMSGVFGVVGPRGGYGGLAFSFCMSIILALSGRWFYWKAVDRMVSKAWDLHNGNGRAALEWLRAKGGVNVGLVAAILGGILLFLFSIAPQ